MTEDRFEAVFIGAGPVGLSALFEYVESQVNNNQRILLIYPNKTQAQDVEVVTDVKQNFSIAHSEKFATRRFKHYVEVGSYSKGRTYSLGNQGTIESLSYHWGASCFPYPDSGNGQSIIEKKVQFKIAQRWGIQAEFDALSQVYSINGEIIGQLKRKKISKIFSQIGNSINGLVVGYSRLAISTSLDTGCQYCSKCFEGCPQGSPWNPDKDIKTIERQFPQVLIKRAEVDSIRWSGEFYEVRTSESKFTCKSVFLGAGWRNSLDLLSKLTGINLEPEQVVKQSNVLIKPFFLLRRVNRCDFNNSYVYHDNVVITFDENNNVGTFTQIYFPTIDLWMRMLSESPTFLHGLIGFFVKSSKFMSNIGRHFGVAMIFFPGEDWDSDIEVEKQKRKIYRKLNRSLFRISGLLIPGFEKDLFSGQSQHVGSLDKQLASFIKKEFPNLYLVSPLNLDRINPGPHTFSSAIVGATNTVESSLG